MNTQDAALDVSVIIPTRNRRELLRDALESLGRQTLDPSRYELIVADNRSSDGTAEMVAELRRTSPFHLVYLPMADDRGPVISRNAAAKLARGRHLAFTDSDCRLSPQWLEIGVRALDAAPEVGFVTGPVEDKPEQPGGLFTFHGSTGPGEDPTYRTCNIFYRREVFREMGGFDEAAYYGQTGFMHYECADIDLAWRVKERGYPNRFLPELVVFHEVWRVSPFYWLHKQTQLMPLPLFLKRHPHLKRAFLWHDPLIAPANLLVYLMFCGLVAAVVTGQWQWLVLAAPLYLRLLHSLGPGAVFRHPVRAGAQLVFLSLAQAVMCGALMWGSARARRIVL